MSIAVNLTPTEKRAVDLVATVEGKAVSDLLRPTVNEIIARGRKIAARLRDMEPAA